MTNQPLRLVAKDINHEITIGESTLTITPLTVGEFQRLSRITKVFDSEKDLTPEDESKINEIFKSHIKSIKHQNKTYTEISFDSFTPMDLLRVINQMILLSSLKDKEIKN